MNYITFTKICCLHLKNCSSAARMGEIHVALEISVTNFLEELSLHWRTEFLRFPFNFSSICRRLWPFLFQLWKWSVATFLWDSKVCVQVIGPSGDIQDQVFTCVSWSNHEYCFSGIPSTTSLYYKAGNHLCSQLHNRLCNSKVSVDRTECNLAKSNHNN